MDETILFPSPNWFQVSGLAVTTDGWLIYGGPSKSLCVLKPLPPNYDRVLTEVQGFSAHVINRAHSEKIVSVDVCPEWPTKKLMLTGSADGSVKQWKIEQNDKSLQIKSTHSHDIHCQEKEEVIGVGYSTETYGITVGDFGHVVKWDLNSNVVKSYTQFFKNFKPSCLSCSPHVKLTVAVGTKQGVVFVLDLNGPGKTLFKIRGYDEEITNLGWCPQANVVVKKPLSETEKPPNQSSVSSKKNKITKDAQNNKEAIEQKPSLEQSGFGKTLPDDSFDKSQGPGDGQEDSKLDICSEQKPSLEHSCIGKTLPDDSFGKSQGPVEVQEDSMFDIYKDHEADEFGHKKYTPENVLVKEKPEKDTSNNFLAECLRLKDDILKRKVTEPEATIESLVEALDNTHMDNQETNLKDKDHKQIALEASDHIHSNLLATISKQGGVRIWSKTGKLVASCAVPNVGNKFQKNKPAQCTTLLWYKPDVLLIADGKSELLKCNPLIVESKNKLGWSLVHSLHKRGLYAIASDAPRVQNDVPPEQAESWSVWTISQERNFVRYSIENKEARSIYGTCGGYIYMLQACPYDARRIAVSVGDGAARIWETDTLERNDNKLTSGSTLMFWQNVQGKVLTVAWHPTKENLLAFATAESRVGLIDTSKSEKAARVLLPALRGGVYSLCWGEGNELYACGGGELVVYKTKNADEAPKPITVRLDNQPRQVCTIRLQNKMLVCGTQCGGVVIMQDNNPVCSIYAFSKMIHTTEWHPQQTSSSSEDSQYKNLIAVCSLDKSNSIAILEFSEKEDGTKQLSTWKTLSGHRAAVLQLSWNPHKEGFLLSTSNDCTVRVWDISLGQCVSIFGNHAQSSLSAIWCAFPQHVTKVLSGGGDCCLRLWDYRDHLPEDYDSSRHELPKREKRNKKGKKSPTQAQKAEDEEEADVNLAANLEHSIKGSKKFLLPIINKQISQNGGKGVRKMFNRYLKLKSKEFHSGAGDADNSKEFDNDFVKMFGTNCEVNEVLDLELSRHKANHNWEAFTMLCLLRGDVTTAMNAATARGTLCPFLLSLAPALSHKYWKDVTQLYLQQVDRSIAKNEEEKLCELLPYGGAVFRKMAIQLSIQDLKGAVATLIEAKLHKEAYVLCRIRYMDSIAEETLKQWADYCVYTGTHEVAVICFLALENLSKAAALLGQSDHQELLILAADIAKIAGQNTLVDRMVEKQALVKNTEETREESVEQALNELPSRIELLMKNNCDSEPVNGNAALKASK